MIAFNLIVLVLCQLFAGNVVAAAKPQKALTMKDEFIKFHQALEGPDGAKAISLAEAKFNSVGLIDLAPKVREALSKMQDELLSHGKDVFKNFEDILAKARCDMSAEERLLLLMGLVYSILEKSATMRGYVDYFAKNPGLEFKTEYMLQLDVVSSLEELKDGLQFADVTAFVKETFGRHAPIRHLRNYFDKYAEARAQSSHS
ncbi:cytochrome P450 2U1 [Babesia caballi]|uniref:Cytochrome P450 2U1 n=1 Tax=Babesia caballi TaxID=5871 RepID=A0AAV4LW08_BABCB|nr:cytochrome P450 2U1 [Babesia caballi]